MDRRTVDVYEQGVDAWHERRRPSSLEAGAALGARAAESGGGRPVIDIGCGPGWFSASLGPSPVIALDAARAMLELVPGYAPDAWRVQADAAHLPFRRGALGGAFASKSYVHLPRDEVPLALADLHRAMAVDAPLELVVFNGDVERGRFDGDELGGRLYSEWPARHLVDVVTGAGFVIESTELRPARRSGELVLTAHRARTLADTVGPGMRLLVVGLNPSLYAADAGVGFARPGNRFWPAARQAGLVSRDRDPIHALVHHGVGMTDLVKRATARASELSAAELRAGLARVTRLVEWLQPSAVCLVGLTGWRAAVDRRATVGVQPGGLSGSPLYVMPSTSGANAHASLDSLTDHLRAAAALAGQHG